LSILENPKGGLNSDKGTLEQAVQSRSVVHSSQNVQGGNLKHLFVTEECELLDFIVEYVSDTEFHLYMYEAAGATVANIGRTRIRVFKSILVNENGVWDSHEAQAGHAAVAYFGSTNIVAINYKGWQEGNLPVSQQAPATKSVPRP